jgi:hypothetical protein
MDALTSGVRATVCGSSHPFEEILEISSSFGRGGGYNERLDAAAVRLCKRRLECLINVHRFASAGTRDRGMAGPAEVLGVGQLNINVTFGVHGLASASGVIGDAAGSLDLVAHAALCTGSSLVAGCQIIAERGSCRKTVLPWNGFATVHAHLCFPQSRPNR